MKKSRIIARVIWLYLLYSVINAAFISPPGTPAPDAAHDILQYLPFLIAPILFFGAIGLFKKTDPLRAFILKRIIDDKFGEGSFEDFIVELKPMMAFGLMGLGCGAAAFYVACTKHLEFSYLEAAFMTGSGIGFLLARALLKKRGLLMEASAGKT